MLKVDFTPAVFFSNIKIQSTEACLKWINKEKNITW